MKFQVKDMDIASGGAHIAILNEKDAVKLDLRSGDRILVFNGRKKTTCILDISESRKAVSPGKIGLFEEVLDILNARQGNIVDVKFTGKPESVIHIRDKLYGKELSFVELDHIIRDITSNALTDIEKTYFVASGFSNGWTIDEIVNMSKAMVKNGNQLKFKGITLDKHCIGGIPGNRTTMIIVPVIAAAGFTIPKTSSRAITSPAGTADTMECLAKVELSQKKIRSIVKKTKACIVHGGSMNLAPADDKIIDVEHPLSIDPEGQLLASVMAKKYSVSANYVLIDIPFGKSSKAKTRKEARRLKKQFVKVGKRLNITVKAIITDGSHPIGNGIGPLLEAEDVMAVLRNDPLAPNELKEKSVYLAGLMLEMTGKYSRREGHKLALNILESGKALRKMEDMIKAQGKQKKINLGEFRYHVVARHKGRVKEIDNEIISKIARLAGAPTDKGSGLYLVKNIKDVVLPGDILYTIYAQNKFKLELAKDFVKKNKGYVFK